MAESLMSNIKDSIDHLLAFICLSELLGLLVVLPVALEARLVKEASKAN